MDSEMQEGKARQLATWQADSAWVDDLPKVQVSRPKGSFCQLDCSAVVGLHPAAVFETMCDTGNHRIYRNAQGVRNRRVVEDTGIRRVIELEMLTAWRFLFLAGEFPVSVRLTQDLVNHQLYFELAKPGFMKKFRGVWSVEPLPIPPSAKMRPGTAAPRRPLTAVGRTTSNTARALSSPPASDAADLLELALEAADVDESIDDAKDDAYLPAASRDSTSSLPWYGKGTRVASKVFLHQQVQPSVNPPPIFAHYLRGIAAKTIVEAMSDIQLEAARLRYGIPEDCQDVLGELRKRGYMPLATMMTKGEWDGEKGHHHHHHHGGERHRAVGGLKRDWSIGDGRKKSSSRGSRRLSDKEKWKMTKALQDQFKQHCPNVTISAA